METNQDHSHALENFLEESCTILPKVKHFYSSLNVKQFNPIKMKELYFIKIKEKNNRDLWFNQKKYQRNSI